MEERADAEQQVEKMRQALDSRTRKCDEMLEKFNRQIHETKSNFTDHRNDMEIKLAKLTEEKNILKEIGDLKNELEESMNADNDKLRRRVRGLEREIGKLRH